MKSSPRAIDPGKGRCSLGKNRRNIMKTSTKDNAEGKMHQVKGKVKEVVGKVTGNRDLEGEGKDENLNGKIQEKIGRLEKIVGK